MRGSLIATDPSSIRLPAPELADKMLLPAADRKPLRHAAQHDLPVRIAILGRLALEPFDQRARDETVAMDAHEALAEFLLQLGQRLLEQVLALDRADRQVLEFGLEV